MKGKCITSYKRELWYCLTGDGCGSANISWFESKVEAIDYFEKENDGLADVCVGRLTISSDSDIYIKEIDEL